MELKEALIAVKSLIDTPEKWVQGRFHGANNEICTTTALEQVAKNAPELVEPMRQAIASAAGEADSGKYGIGGGVLCRVNNRGHNEGRPHEHNHAELMAIFDKAIAAA